MAAPAATVVNFREGHTIQGAILCICVHSGPYYLHILSASLGRYNKVFQGKTLTRWFKI